MKGTGETEPDKEKEGKKKTKKRKKTRARNCLRNALVFSPRIHSNSAKERETADNGRKTPK